MVSKLHGTWYLVSGLKLSPSCSGKTRDYPLQRKVRPPRALDPRPRINANHHVRGTSQVCKYQEHGNDQKGGAKEVLPPQKRGQLQCLSRRVKTPSGPQPRYGPHTTAALGILEVLPPCRRKGDVGGQYPTKHVFPCRTACTHDFAAKFKSLIPCRSQKKMWSDKRPES